MFLQALQASQRCGHDNSEGAAKSGFVITADADKVIAASATGIAPAAAVQIVLTAAPAQAASTSSAVTIH